MVRLRSTLQGQRRINIIKVCWDDGMDRGFINYFALEGVGCV